MVRFDKPCCNVHGATSYFSEHMAKSDYLTEGGAVPMVWFGEGSQRLGLTGAVDAAHFESLCKGLHPLTNEKLLLRDNGASRRVCYFGQISAPKDVSIALFVGDDQRIAQWWKEAVDETLREIELATLTRVRKGGGKYDRETGNMVSSIVTHDSSRNLDPQLHTHVCIMNVTFDPVEDRWKGVQPSGYFKHQGYFREVCYNKLAMRMLAGGYELEKARKIGFTIKGFPSDLRKRFSKRREEILESAKARKISSQDGLHQIAGSSRSPKQHIETAKLREGWKIEAADDLPAVRQVVAQATGVAKPVLIVTPAQAVAYAEEHVFERRSVANERILLREALIHGRGQVTLEQLKEAIAVRVKAGELIQHGDKVTSKETLKLEQEFIKLANEGRKQFRRWGDASAIDTKLSDEQQQAVQTIFKSRSRMMILQGDAGTGKTATLKEVAKGLERYSNPVFACAPSSGAAEELRKEVTPAADTLQQLLVNLQLQRQIKGNTILVDEAGLISTRQMRDLCRLAQENDNRLILVGDIKQHSSVEAGDALRALHKFAHVELASLRTIRRQKNPEYRKAVSLLAQRKPYQAFAQFEKLGAVHEIKEAGSLFEQAAKDYVNTVQAGKSCLAISPVWSEIHEFTDVVRSELKRHHMLGISERTVSTFSSFQWTKAERKDVSNYQTGDVLEFHRKTAVFEKGEMVKCVERQLQRIVVERSNGDRYAFNPKRITGYDVGSEVIISVAAGEKLLLRGNVQSSSLKNGEIVEVARFDEKGAIRLSDGRQIPEDFRRFTHGYATTSHAAQGKTVDCGIVVLSQEGIQAANLKQAYVSNSRFRERQSFYVTDKVAAREAMATPADRELAIEFTARPELTQKLIGKIARKKKAISKKETMKERPTVVRKLGVRIGVASGGE